MPTADTAPSWTDSLSALATGAAFLVAAAALVVAIYGIRLQRAALAAANKAVEEARRSAEASEESAQAAQRSALAAEQLTEIEAMRDMQPTIAWRLERLSKERVLLRNIGAETATGVSVAQVENFLIDPPHNATIVPQGSVKFGYVVGGLMCEPDALSVTCNELAGPVLVEVPHWP
ncbi:hypothetical protein [Sphaerisporangium album]|nr:hypothetical protein [Sphaerisporangium album]